MKAPKLECTFSLSMSPDMKNYVEKKLSKFSLHIFLKTLNLKNSVPSTQALATFVDSKITEEMMNKMPHLKLIATLSTGFDNVNLEAAKKRGIAVCNVPAYGEVTVAEHALALLFALFKNIPASNTSVKNGEFSCLNFQGRDIQGKTVGVIGTGKIGANFIKLLSGLGVKVLAFDAYPNKALAKELHFTYVPLKKLLHQSDAISLHVPLLPQTTHLINKEALSSIKKGSILINTSRGAVVDSIALVQALKKGTVGGAGLDVLEGENYLKGLSDPENAQAKKICDANTFLVQHPSVIVTPHNAFNTAEAVQRIFDTTFQTLLDFSQGKKLKNRIV